MGVTTHDNGNRNDRARTAEPPYAARLYCAQSQEDPHVIHRF
jgi:hypothetical protein